ncbi:MAG: AEC family transporter [Rhodospirillaceae bacterium]|jgi:malonate transporter and related proteins|nr:AEC family transporter [Rhodospirillaceae bacterium]MBT5374736.1 AEC family transporter [Rhodospirillaceae bacterium]MBT5660139.1 AEC family transporter [Rhodospirillaceae bacterium]MBT5752208.1 AEC family transporter [Rhodospirillaceae bacterium]
MTHIIQALAPVFALILLGHLMHRGRFPSVAFWEAADRLTFYVLFPALIIHTLGRADLSDMAVGGMAAALALPVLANAGFLSLLRPRLGLDGPAYTSVFQGAIRPNTFVGLASAEALFGHAGLTLAAVAVVALIPLVNVLSALSLARHARDKTSRLMQIRLIALNPLILACLIGIGLNVSGIGLPSISAPIFAILGQAALTLGLLSVGAGLDLAAARRSGPPLWLSSGLKLIALPAMTFGLLFLFDIEGITATIALLFAALPTSATAYVMARQLGGDHTLMASIITTEVVLAIITLPVVLYFVR